uniref:ADP-ribosyl cyclase/cyclic ADP-ribose hydrolase n=1 Tax=Manihot esculenta TaxID=3983 RepID=A0A2C9UPJ9_MANES
MPASSCCKYDVFLSFRGEDTRKNFTSHLYAGLCQKGILTFKDDKELERGKTISQELLKAIQDSKICIVIFSTSYASSSWCLDELAHIFECMKTKGQLVMPVFYHVNPTDVRKQTGDYGKSFAQHEQRLHTNLNKIQQWRTAMTGLANLSGWDLQDSGSNELRNRLHRKRVLIVLDDVNQLDQLKFLAGMHDWFGKGSRIIITSRDEHLLTCHGVDKIYRVEGLSDDEALHLFCLKAFKSDYPTGDYVELTNHFVNYCNGLPLALDVIGSFLFCKSVNEWRSALSRLKDVPNQKISGKLYISFNGLEEIEKKIFLDIACFFNGEDKDHVMQVLETCGFYPEIGIRVLINKSLITISKERIWMHDLLQEMGRDIVRQESAEEPGKRSRLWLFKDVEHVLSNDKGTEQIEGIVLDSCNQQDAKLSAKSFTKMKRLRLLKLRNLHFSQGLEYLSNKLRYLEWDGYPFKSLPSTFQPDTLVELHMRCSNMEHLWKGVIKPLKKLKVIDLSFSINLIKTTDFKDAPNLEKLNLEGCTRLLEVHQSIGDLKRLVLLNLKDCKSLIRLPNSICDLKSLKFLNLHGCSKLEKLPERLGDMTSLEKLYAGGITTRQAPSTKLWDFFLPSRLLPWKNQNPTPNQMVTLLPSLLVLRSLRSLDLSYCNLVEGALPSDMSCFPSLRTLNLSGNDFFSIPSSISRLSKLEDFRFANCKKLQVFPSMPSSILYLSMDGCSALESLLPRSISRQFELENLCAAVDCKRLQLLPDLSSCILYLSVDGLTAEDTIPNPFGTNTTRPSSLTLVSCLKLFEVQSKNISAFGRLTSYLHYLLRHSSQGLFSPSSHISMCLAGTEIPGWFNYQSPGSSLEIHLPPYWWATKWMGFAFCIEFGFHEPLPDSSTISCDLHACITPNQDLFLGHTAVEISKDMIVTSDQLWFNYMPRSSLTCLDLWEACCHLKVTFSSNHLRVKYCGLRAIYGRDLDDLVTCSNPFQNLGLPCNDNVEKSKRSRDEYSCGSGREPNESGSLPAKRLRMAVDPES